MGEKKWWQSRAMVAGILAVLLAIYKFVQENFVPSLPIPSDAWVDSILVFLTGLGLFGRAVAKTKITKALIVFLMAFMVCMSGPAHADLFGDRTQERKMKASLTAEEPVENMNAPLVEWGSIADILAALSGKLGVKEGTFFDVENTEFRNYLATTLYTMPEGVAFNVGMVGLDGVIGSVDYNIGALIPDEDVPLIGLFEYLYVGYGAGWKDEDDQDANLEEASDWEFVHGPTVVFKATF